MNGERDQGEEECLRLSRKSAPGGSAERAGPWGQEVEPAVVFNAENPFISRGNKAVSSRPIFASFALAASGANHIGKRARPVGANGLRVADTVHTRIGRGPFCFSAPAVSHHSEKNDPCGDPGREQRHRMGLRVPNGTRSELLERISRNGGVDQALHPLQIVLAGMHRDVVSVIVVMPLEVDTVSGEAVRDETADGLIGGLCVSGRYPRQRWCAA